MAQSHETQKLPNPIEQVQHSPEQIATAFKEAHAYMYTVTDDDEFQLACMDLNVDPDQDMHKAIYWKLLARRSQELVRESREANGDSLELRAKELLCLTPAAMFETVLLESSVPRTREAKRSSKQALSFYNGLIRDFAISEPQTPVDMMKKALIGMANTSIETPAMRQFASIELNKVVSGTQAELGFRQILSKTHHNFRNTSVQEDLEGGDIVIINEGFQPLYIDVKSSMSQIGDTTNPYRRVDHNHIKIFGYAHPQEFNNTFFIPDELAAERAPRIGEYLSTAQEIAA